MSNSFVSKTLAVVAIIAVVLCFAFALVVSASFSPGVAFADSYSPIAVGDTITQLYFKTSGTPDLSCYDFTSADFETDGVSCITILRAGNVAILACLDGSTPVLGYAFYENNVLAGIDIIYNGTSWSTSIISTYNSQYLASGLLVTSVDTYQNIWGDYVSKSVDFKPPTPPTPYDIGGDIVEILVGGISGIASGLGEGLSDMAVNVFMTGTGDSQTLSTFGILVICFAGIALVIGLTRWVVNFVSSLGSRNR